MATLSVPYLLRRQNRIGAPRWYWQPSTALRKAGHRPRRLPADWRGRRHDSHAALERAAIAEAQEINARIQGAPHAPLFEPGTMAALIVHFRGSSAWQRLAPETQAFYDRCFNRLPTALAKLPARVIGADDLRAWLNRSAATAPMRAALARAFHRLFAFAREIGWRSDNPMRAERRQVAPTSPDLVWPDAAVIAFAAHAAKMGLPSIGRAVQLNAWLGQREADLLAAAPASLHNGVLTVRQAKTGATVALPLGRVPSLAELVARLPKDGPGLLISEHTKLPWRPSAFAHQFARIRGAIGDRVFALGHCRRDRDPADPTARQVAMRELTFMCLRHSAVTRLAEAGCTPAEIRAVTGHTLASVNRILERYLVRTLPQAEHAFDKRLTHEGAAQ